MGFNDDEAHYNYGVLLGLQSRWTEAAAAYRLALEANPLHAQARNNLGQTARRRAQAAEATDQYRQAVAADPLLRLARYNLGRMLLAARQVEEAAAEFEKLREPQDAESPRYRVRAGGRQRSGRAARTAGVQLAQQAGNWPSASASSELVAAIDRDLAGLK